MLGRGQLAIANRNANSSEIATSAALKQLEITSAAFLRNDIRIQDKRNVGVEFTNVGKSPATDISATLVISLRSIPDNMLIGKEKSRSRSIPDVPNQGDPNINKNYGYWPYSFVFTADELKMIKEGKAAILTKLTYSYDNGFRNIKDGDCQASLGFEEDGYGYHQTPCVNLPDDMQNLRKRWDAQQRLHKSP